MTASFTTSALAQDPAPFRVRGIAANGTGCPRGTVDALSSQGNGTQALSILFSAFTADGTRPTSGVARGEMKTCNIAIDLEPLQGIQVSLINIETRGTASVFGSQNTQRGLNNVVKITREYFFNDANSNGYRFPLLDTYLVNTQSAWTITEDAIGLTTFADCNARIIARARMTLMTTGELNMGAIDSVDQNAELKFNFRTRRCTGNDPKGDAVIIDVDGLDDRAKVKNACVLRGVRNGVGGRQVCYDESGDIL